MRVYLGADHAGFETKNVIAEHLKIQWSQSAARVGLALDPNFSNSSAVNPAMDGIVVTYAQVGRIEFVQENKKSTCSKQVLYIEAQE